MGNKNAGEFRLAWYLSTDADITVDDLLLDDGRATVLGLDAGATASISPPANASAPFGHMPGPSPSAQGSVRYIRGQQIDQTDTDGPLATIDDMLGGCIDASPLFSLVTTSSLGSFEDEAASEELRR